MSPATEERLRSRLREQPLPGEGEAAERSWRVVEAALAERSPVGPPRRLVLRLALVAALLCIGLVAALTPAGAEVGDWIGDRFADRGEPAPAFAGLPPGQPVLAISRTAAYAIDPDGGSQWLGSFSDAGWSPHGLHVVGVDGRRLTAVDPTGVVKWTLARRSPVHHPSWSTRLGYAVAYLEGRTLRVVAGTGDPATDRRVRRGGRRPGRGAARARLVARCPAPRGAVVTFGHGSGCERSHSANDRAARRRSRARAPPVGPAGVRGGRRRRRHPRARHPAPRRG